MADQQNWTDILREMREVTIPAYCGDDIERAEFSHIANRLEATIRAHIEGLEAQLSESRDTNRRLNRRVQEAEAAIPSYRKLVAEPPNGDGVRFVNGNMGRALLAHYCNQATERAEAAERDARELRDTLQRAREDINWMLNNRQFLNGPVFDYLDAAIATTERAGRE